jgi:hypothetical protein
MPKKIADAKSQFAPAIFDLRRAETVSKSSPGDIRLSTAAPGRAAGKNEV